MSFRGVDRFREWTRKHKEVTAFVTMFIVTALILLFIFTPALHILLFGLVITTFGLGFLSILGLVCYILEDFWWRD